LPAVHQRDVEIARVEQAPDHAMHLPVELGQAVGRHRHLGDVVQRGLQLLGAAALGHFILQAVVGALQSSVRRSTCCSSRTCAWRRSIAVCTCCATKPSSARSASP
jgi:hypothetical protein